MTVKTQGLVLLLELAAVAVETIYRGTAGRRWWAVDSASLTSSGKAPQRTDPKSGKLQGGSTEFSPEIGILLHPMREGSLAFSENANDPEGMGWNNRILTWLGKFRRRTCQARFPI